MTNTAVDIKIPNIEKELDRLWKEAEDQKKQKACLFTLIIYAHEARRVQYLQDLVDSILDKFPCRIIFIKADNQSNSSFFHVDVSTVMIGNIKQKSTIACDRITIEVSKDQLFRVPYLITPHLVPDLPVQLLWGQNPFEENAIFPHLQPMASRVIFDSECSDNLNLFCTEMLQNLETLQTIVVDINWALVSNWRDLLYQLFMSEEMVAELNRCKAITINYNHSHTEMVQHPEIRAIYLQGWLASRLRWKGLRATREKGQMKIRYAGPQTPIDVAVIPQSYDDLPPGSIASIDILLPDDQSYVLFRKPNLSQVVVHASSKLECQMPFTLPLPSVHRGLTFMKEIFYSHPSEHYREMLKTISQIQYPN